MTLLSLLLSIVLGTISLAWGYWQVGLPQFSQWIVMIGVVWIIAVWQNWRWFAYVGLTLYFLVASLGLWFLNFPPGWMFAGSIGALLAWDLTYFRYRQRFASSDEERQDVEARHLVRVAVVVLIGFGLASVAMLVKLQFNFEWALLLAVVAALGIMQIVSWFRKRN